MVYETPLHLQALRDFALKGSKIETIAVAAPTPEEIERARSIREKIRDFGRRLSTPYSHRYHHEPRTENPQLQVPEYVQEPELVSA